MQWSVDSAASHTASAQARSGIRPPWNSRHIDGSASARGEAPPIVAFPTPPAIKTDPRPNVAARRSALMV
jgi:hypothetical protein